MAWRVIPCCLSELCLEHTLKCGQSFRWREASPGVWTGVIGQQVWRLRQDESRLYYQVFHKDQAPARSETKDGVEADVKSQPKESDFSGQNVQADNTKTDHSIEDEEKIDVANIKDGANQKTSDVTAEVEVKEELVFSSDYDNVLRDYFQLNVNLGKLYKSWSEADPNLKKISTTFEGIRMLRQDPVENLFSFICSSNNHISRISSMVEKLCDHYGEEIADVDGKLYHAFPRVSSLASSGVEGRLRELGFGYRAKYINTTAKYICDNHSEDWLYSLRSMPYKEAKRELMKLCGVGAKVADCVCLMSMDKPGSIPVDTHIWQIASRHYLTKLQHSKSLTEKLYDEIGDYFRNLWGDYAGWAHSVLFAADLKHFKDSKQKPSSKTVKRSAQNKGKDGSRIKCGKKK